MEKQERGDCSLEWHPSSSSSFVPPLGVGGPPIFKEGSFRVFFPKCYCLEALGFSSTFRMKAFFGSDRERFFAEVALFSGLLMGFFLFGNLAASHRRGIS